MKRLKRSFSIALFSLFTLAVSPALHAEIIASSTLFTSGNNTTASTFQVRFGLFTIDGPVNTIFENLTLSAANVGQSFEIFPADDSDYSTLIGKMTDGTNQFLNFELSFNNFASVASGRASRENIFFNPLPSGNNGIDFQGFSIDSMILRVDSVTINPNSFSITTTILVDPISAVPEPSSAALALLGAAAVVIRRRVGR